MAVRIITDSTADIARGQQEALGIEIVPLLVRFGQEEFVDGVSLSNREFYERLEHSEELPTTAQVTPERFEQVFGKYGAEDEIVGIFISSEMSGTYQSAVIAKEQLNNSRIHLIDSRNVTFALGLLVYEAVRMRDAGHTAGEICDEIGLLIKRMRFYIVLDTLKYLKMGGRLSSSSALLGTMLRVKPIITVTNGLVTVFEKKQGRKAALEEIVQLVKKERPDQNLLVTFGDSVAPDMVRMLKESLEGELNLENSRTLALGAVVGTHGGPGAAGIAYFAKAD
jgi:EDD domain protein, DegV family